MAVSDPQFCISIVFKTNSIVLLNFLKLFYRCEIQIPPFLEIKSHSDLKNAFSPQTESCRLRLPQLNWLIFKRRN
jgi:hypothetical protein